MSKDLEREYYEVKEAFRQLFRLETKEANLSNKIRLLETDHQDQTDYLLREYGQRRVESVMENIYFVNLVVELKKRSDKMIDLEKARYDAQRSAQVQEHTTVRAMNRWKTAQAPLTAQESKMIDTVLGKEKFEFVMMEPVKMVDDLLEVFGILDLNLVDPEIQKRIEDLTEGKA